MGPYRRCLSPIYKKNKNSLTCGIVGELVIMPACTEKTLVTNIYFKKTKLDGVSNLSKKDLKSLLKKKT